MADLGDLDLDEEEENSSPSECGDTTDAENEVIHHWEGLKKGVMSHPARLQLQCLLYIIGHISTANDDPFTNALGLLPRWVRTQLLLLLPAVDVAKLEDTPVTHGISMNEIWNTIYKNRLPLYKKGAVRRAIGNIFGSLDDFHDAGVESISWKEAYFNTVFLFSLFYNRMTTLEYEDCTCCHGHFLPDLFYGIGSFYNDPPAPQIESQLYQCFSEESTLSIHDVSRCVHRCPRLTPGRYYDKFTSPALSPRWEKGFYMSFIDVVDEMADCNISLKHLVISKIDFAFYPFENETKILDQLSRLFTSVEVIEILGVEQEVFGTIKLDPDIKKVLDMISMHNKCPIRSMKVYSNEIDAVCPFMTNSPQCLLKQLEIAIIVNNKVSSPVGKASPPVTTPSISETRVIFPSRGGILQPGIFPIPPVGGPPHVPPIIPAPPISQAGVPVPNAGNLPAVLPPVFPQAVVGNLMAPLAPIIPAPLAPIIPAPPISQAGVPVPIAGNLPAVLPPVFPQAVVGNLMPPLAPIIPAPPISQAGVPVPIAGNLPAVLPPVFPQAVVGNLMAPLGIGSSAHILPVGGGMASHPWVTPSNFFLNHPQAQHVSINAAITCSIDDILQHQQHIESFTFLLKSLSDYKIENGVLFQSIADLLHRPILKKLYVCFEHNHYKIEASSDIVLCLIRMFFSSPNPVSLALNLNCPDLSVAESLTVNNSQSANKSLELLKCRFSPNFSSLFPPNLILKSLKLDSCSSAIICSFADLESITLEHFSLCDCVTQDNISTMSSLFHIVNAQKWDLSISLDDDKDTVERFIGMLSKIAHLLCRFCLQNSFSQLDRAVSIYKCIFQFLSSASMSSFELSFNSYVLSDVFIKAICKEWEDCSPVKLKKIIVHCESHNNEITPSCMNILLDMANEVVKL